MMERLKPFAFYFLSRLVPQIGAGGDFMLWIMECPGGGKIRIFGYPVKG